MRRIALARRAGAGGARRGQRVRAFRYVPERARMVPDWYDPGYYAISPAENPGGPEHGKRRSSRGGAWRHHIKCSRCAARSSIPPEFRYADYGFRVAADG
jgi:formylglycine-generating enzyme required for sulfatase activity